VRVWTVLGGSMCVYVCVCMYIYKCSLTSLEHTVLTRSLVHMASHHCIIASLHHRIIASSHHCIIAGTPRQGRLVPSSRSIVHLNVRLDLNLSALLAEHAHAPQLIICDLL
jgi:hypothetical protein